MKRTLLRSMAVAALLLIPASLAAQITAGRLDGVARDEQGLVLPGVTVTFESPGLLGSRVAVTDVDGSFRFQGLPAGSYTMTFELGGFGTVVREDVTVNTGQTFTVNQTLAVAAVAETVTVTGESPVVDVKSSRFGGTFDDTAILEVPNSTDPHAMLALTPGIRMRGFDVAGSHKAQQSGFDAFGLRNQNRIIIDGVDSNFSTGGFGFYMDSLTVNQFNISNAGADVENAWAGNTIVMDIKTGGNELSALLYGDYLSEGFVGDNLTSELEGRGAGTNHMLTYWEAHADVGGPLWRDKAWFFLAYNNNLTHRAISGLDPEVIQEEAILRNYYAKVNMALSEKDELIGYSQWGLKYRPNRGINALNSPDVRLAQDSWTWVHKAEWQRVWSDRGLLEREGDVLRGHLADGACGNSGHEPATRGPRHLAPDRRRRLAVHLRQGAAAVCRHPELLRPRRRGEPRPQVRGGLHGGRAALLLERRVGVHPVSGPLEPRLGDQFDGNLRDSLREHPDGGVRHPGREPALLRAGHLADQSPVDDHRRDTRSAPVRLLQLGRSGAGPSRIFPQRGLHSREGHLHLDRLLSALRRDL